MKKLIACTLLVSSSVTANAAAVSGQGTWESTLLARDLYGTASTAEAYYDTVLDVTWLADVNYASTQYINSGGTEGFLDGTMSWWEAMNWTANLNIGGVTGWRLYEISDPDNHDGNFYNNGVHGYNADTSKSEMASLYYDTLGNHGYRDTGGSVQENYGMLNTGPFFNIPPSYVVPGEPEYEQIHTWSATDTGGSEVTSVFDFNLALGSQGTVSTQSNSYIFAWAVHDGDVGTAVVPIPAAVWLFGSGLIGLVGMARRKSSS